ncbi:hypothetical protein HK102_011168 [Quaeritorhiza haematococci]|nr:hypothetical protein HK102_011168 [Quaeritorhiza haematococci]
MVKKYRKKIVELDNDDNVSQKNDAASSSKETNETKPVKWADEEDEEGEGMSSVLQEALELRKLRRKMKVPGIDAHELLKGDAKRREKEEAEKAAAENDDPFKMKSSGGLFTLEDIKKTSDANAKLGSFATESNAMDTERLMQQFIDKELRKRRGLPEDEEQLAEKPQEEPVLLDKLKEQLFAIPDHLKIEEKPVSEGNVTLSAGMLTSIPEVDLGISNKLKNIEATERAKKQMAEKKMDKKDTLDKLVGANFVAADRFAIGRRNRQHRDEFPNDRESGAGAKDDRGGRNDDGQRKKFDRRTMATDDLVMERFKKRVRRG